MPQPYLTLCDTMECSPTGSMGFSRQEYWSGSPRPPPGEFPNRRIEPASLTSPALAVRFFTASAAWEAHSYAINVNNNSFYNG